MEYEWLKLVQKFKRIYENNQRWYTVMYNDYVKTLQGSKLKVKLVNKTFKKKSQLSVYPCLLTLYVGTGKLS